VREHLKLRQRVPGTGPRSNFSTGHRQTWEAELEVVDEHLMSQGARQRNGLRLMDGNKEYRALSVRPTSIAEPLVPLSIASALEAFGASDRVWNAYAPSRPCGVGRITPQQDSTGRGAGNSADVGADASGGHAASTGTAAVDGVLVRASTSAFGGCMMAGGAAVDGSLTGAAGSTPVGGSMAVATSAALAGSEAGATAGAGMMAGANSTVAAASAVAAGSVAAGVSYDTPAPGGDGASGLGSPMCDMDEVLGRRS